jgi:hypothetical protein
MIEDMTVRKLSPKTQVGYLHGGAFRQARNNKTVLIVFALKTSHIPLNPLD